jgi:hypothetical protein
LIAIACEVAGQLVDTFLEHLWSEELRAPPLEADVIQLAPKPVRLTIEGGRERSVAVARVAGGSIGLYSVLRLQCVSLLRTKKAKYGTLYCVAGEDACGLVGIHLVPRQAVAVLIIL